MSDGSNRIAKIEDSEKIAAGEVVERPASVVKELVENALDAGATKITVIIENYGKDLIEVVDDGGGIHPDDLELAFEKHTSSKIHHFADLNHLVTLGFRGEALASVGLVARVMLASRIPDQDSGMQIHVENGQVIKKQPIAREVGTTVSVRNLFYNVPARRKFLKTDRVELGHMSDIITRYALAYPGIHFRYFHDGALLLNSPPTDDLQQAVAHCYGVKTAKEMVPTEYDDPEAGIHVRGLISTPTLTRGSRNDSSLFVNHRFIKSKELFNAVLRAYKNMLMKRRFPLVILFIEIAPSQIDVNIHPAKKHIRFANVQRVFNCVMLGVSRTLRDIKAIPGESPGAPIATDRDNFGKNLEPSSEPTRVGGVTGVEQETSKHPVLESHEESISLAPPPEQAPKTVQLRLEGVDFPSGPGNQRSRKVFIKSREDKLPPLRPINEVGQIFNTYILLEGPDSLYILDQHAASERVTYEKIKKRTEKQPLTMQLLLAPVKIDFSLQETELLQEMLPQFLKLGFEIEHFGGQTFLLRKVPAFFGHTSDPETLRATINDLIGMSAKTSFEEAQEEVINYMACHGSIRAGDPLSLAEIRKLIRALGKCDDPYHCCHGRPTIIKITPSELEGRFKRRV